MPLPKPVYTADDYWNLPDGVRAELIDGELWDLASPSRVHQRIVHELDRRLGNFIDEHGGSCEVYPAPFAVNLFADDTTFVEPDVCVVCDHSKLSDRGCEGAPDLVVEVVSPSSSGMDYVSKLHLYHDAGVREYWICDPIRERVLVYDFASERLLSEYGFEDTVRSSVFEGFTMDFAQVVAGM
ncbi:MAG: Uma2 family endonuclease [Coriobacteriales bacterium]|nr:Uma2 family endonuclease [Coriobacteriales bacterium]